MLINLLVKNVSKGGSLLMNVGPTPRGVFDERADNALNAYAKWMKYNSRSIYGCTMAEPEFIAPEGARLTQSVDGKRLYVHLVEYPFKRLILKDMKGKVKYAQFLHDGSELLFSEKATGEVVIQLPVVKPNVISPVVEIIL